MKVPGYSTPAVPWYFYCFGWGGYSWRFFNNNAFGERKSHGCVKKKMPNYGSSADQPIRFPCYQRRTPRITRPRHDHQFVRNCILKRNHHGYFQHYRLVLPFLRVWHPSFSPCVFSLVPAYVGYLSGIVAGNTARRKPSRWLPSSWLAFVLRL